MMAKQTIKDTITWEPVKVKLGDLKPWGHNPRQSTKVQAARILQSFSEFGQVQAVAVGPELDVYDGHQRLSALLTLHGKGYEIDARRSSVALDEAQRQRLVLMLHAGATGEWDWQTLSNWDSELLQSSGIDAVLLVQMNRDAAAIALMLGVEDEGLAGEAAEEEPERPTLADRFIVPPFSVLDARQGYWQERKRAWLAIGIQSELGRGENALDMSAAMVGITDERERDGMNQGVKMAMHNDPMQRKAKYDQEG